VSRSTQSRTTIPAIVSAHLRDHADPRRIERGWSRLERHLPAGAAHARQRQGHRWLLMTAAAVAGFVLGIGADRWLSDSPTRAGGEQPHLARPVDASPQQVFAAGETRRQYPLPGGGHLTLAPGTIVDTVTRDGRGLTLRLVRGEASMSTQAGTAAARSTPLALLVGDAQVHTTAGNVRVRRSGETAELEVLDGSARIDSPDLDLGTRQTTLEANQKLTVPIRIATAQLDRPRVAPAPQAVLPDEEVLTEEPAVDPVVEAPAGWREQCREGEWAEARRLLQEQTGGGRAAVAAASNAWDLMCIRDAFGSRGGDPTVVLVALERIVAEFPTSPQLRPALWYLAEMYKRAGKPQQANGYLERYRSLSPDGALADDALCKLIQNSAAAGKVDAVLRQAQQYRTQYPDGPCIEEIDELLAEIAAKQGEPAEAEPAPSADESSPPNDGESAADGPGDRAPRAQPERPTPPDEPQPDGAEGDD
jgi:ferric-dicitrate binding protein FerR (iron transport regulator)